jgi:hypothetical protein
MRWRVRFEFTYWDGSTQLDTVPFEAETEDEVKGLAEAFRGRYLRRVRAAAKVTYTIMKPRELYKVS